MTEVEKQREAFLAGYAAAMRMYAIWNNGEQFIGVRQRPLKAALEQAEDDPVVEMDFAAFLRKKAKIRAER